MTVSRLPRKLNAAVMAPPYEGRPGFPETHSLFQGGLLSGASSLCKQLQGYDLVVVIGAPVFRYYPYAHGAYLPEGTRLILLTDSTEEVARAVAGDGIVCDPARACATLVELLPKATRKAPEPRNPLPAPEVKDKITADYVYYTVTKLRPKNSVITQESASSAGPLLERLPPSEPRSFFCSFSGVLGYGLPAACGVVLAVAAIARSSRCRVTVRRSTSFRHSEMRPSRNCPFCSSSFVITNTTFSSRSPNIWSSPTSQDSIFQE